MPPKKILLAEDDSDDATLFHDYLKDRKDIALLSIVENGIELLEYLKNTDGSSLPDLIILDQNMPKKNGMQTLDQLKSSSTYAHIPVIIYSTYADIQLETACKLKGAVLVASKPLNYKGYQEMMDEFLKVVSNG